MPAGTLPFVLRAADRTPDLRSPEERQEALAAKDGDNIVTRLLKMGMRKIVNGIDKAVDLAEPLTKKMESFGNPQTAAKHIFKGLWNTVKGWF